MNIKSFFIIFLVFAFYKPVKAQYDFEAIERARMANAKVRTQTQWTHDYVNGRPSAKGYKSAVTRYNARGNVTEITNFNETGKIISLIVYQYDNRDNRVNFERYTGNREKLQYSQKAIFDSRGNKTREHGFDGASQYNNTYAYDASGRLTEIVYTTDNAVTEKRQFSYSGNKVEISVYDQRNNLLFKQINTNNDKGFLVSEVRTGLQGNSLHSLNLKYNNAGNVTEEVKKRADDKVDYQKIYHYDKDNRPIKIETVNLGGPKFVSNEYQYNSMGDLIFESWRKTEKTSEPSTKKYTYDAKGLYTEVDSYFATYKLNSLYKYVYEFF